MSTETANRIADHALGAHQLDGTAPEDMIPVRRAHLGLGTGRYHQIVETAKDFEKYLKGEQS